MPPSNNVQQVMLDSCYIMLNGSDLTQAEMAKLSSVEVDCTPEIPSMCVMVFYDDDTTLMNSSKLDIGKPLKISFKPRTANQKTVVFNGEIVSIEPIFEDNDVMLKVTAFDKLHRLNKGTFSRVFAQSSDSDIIRKLIGEGGLSGNVTTTSTVSQHIFQDNVPDLSFITYLAHRNGLWVKFNPTSGAIDVVKNTTADSGVSLRRGENLRFFRPRLSSAQQVTKVEVKSWDMKNKKALVGTASSSSTQPTVGYSGSGVSNVNRAHSISPAILEFQPDVRTAGQAGVAAQARLDEMNSQFLVADGCCEGNPDIQPNTKIEILNLGERFSGKYVVTRVIHRYTADEGYLCDFVVEGGSALTIGHLVMAVKTPDAQLWPGVYPAIVTNNKDPDQMARVKLKYPWLDENLESDWTRIISSGAGPTRGILNLPEVNDEVLVAFEGGNFNLPYVIGGLWNGKDAIPLHPVNNSGVIDRVWKTRTGHELHFFEDNGTSKVELKEKDGILVRLDGTNKKIQIQDKPGSNLIEIDINGGKITVKAANAVEVTAPNIKLAGSAGVKIESSGMVEIKGAMVKVN